MRAVLFLCIALLGVSAAFAADSKGPSTWLRDYMSPAKASAMSGYYEQVEKATMCFRTARYCDDGADPRQEIHMLACAECPEFHHSKYAEDSEFAVTDVASPTLGKCFLNKDYKAGGAIVLPDNSSPKWLGTFYGTCYMERSGKDHCELPEDCEDTVLSVQGVMYRVDKAVRVGPALDNGAAEFDCLPERRMEGTAEPTKPVAPNTPAKLQAAKYYYYEEKPPAQVPVGYAEVLDGQFTVHGAHPLKYKSGHFQFSWFPISQTLTPTDYAQTTTYPKLGDAAFKMEFVGDSKSHY